MAQTMKTNVSRWNPVVDGLAPDGEAAEGTMNPHMFGHFKQAGAQEASARKVVGPQKISSVTVMANKQVTNTATKAHSRCLYFIQNRVALTHFKRCLWGRQSHRLFGGVVLCVCLFVF